MSAFAAWHIDPRTIVSTIGSQRLRPTCDIAGTRYNFRGGTPNAAVSFVL